MASTLVLGRDKAALIMTKILCSAGERVSLVGTAKAAKSTLRSMMQEEVEKDIPFQFVDDLKHQTNLLEKRMKNIQMYDRISEVKGDIKMVVTTDADNTLDISPLGSLPVANLTSNLPTNNHVAVRMYQPIEMTKMAQVIVTPSTDPTSLSCVRSLLETMGITEITSEQAESADAMLESSPRLPLDDIIFSILPNRKPIDYSHSIMH